MHRWIPALAALTACGSPTPIPPTPDCEVGFADRDGDGYGNPQMRTSSCQEPVVANELDCDDLRSGINPDADEVCDGVDNNCSGLIDEDDPTLLGGARYPDGDGDGFGDADAAPVTLCEDITGYVANADDCDDTDPAIHPDAVEVCGGVDDDCDGLIDDDDPDVDPASFLAFLPDTDDDGFGDPLADAVMACEGPAGTVANAGDCDDSDPTAFPGAPERCNLVDSDCNGFVDSAAFDGSDPCAALQGSYQGPYQVTLSGGGSGGAVCSGTATVTVDRDAPVAVSGAFTCTLDAPLGDFALLQSGSIDGWISPEGAIEGTVEAFAGSERDWTGTADGATLTGDGGGLLVDGASAYPFDFEWTLTAP